MNIDATNPYTFAQLSFHDYVFAGFVYDYDNRNITLTCSSEWEKKRFSFCFQNIVVIWMQSCCFWGRGNSIYDIWIDENPVDFNSLVNLQKENSSLYSASYLNRGIDYISVRIQLNSGDEFHVTCERLTIDEICDDNLN